MITNTEKEILAILKNIFEVSEICLTRTYIWGGLVPDIATGHFIRPHHDIDGFTFELWRKRGSLAKLYKENGFTVTFLDDFHMMKIERNGVHASLNRLNIENETAMWRHIGDNGTVYFPKKWLPEKPDELCGIKAYIPGIRFEYCIKMEPSLLNPEWKPREKDLKALKWLQTELENNRIDKDRLFDDIWSCNPYWAKQGYKEYEKPIYIRR